MVRCSSPTDVTRELLKVIFSIEQIEEQQVTLTMQDQLYKCLAEPKGLSFPVHQSVMDIMAREWKDPKSKLFFPRSLIRWFFFDDKSFRICSKCPKVDVAVGTISKKIDLDFTDMGHFSNSMDKEGRYPS